MKKIQQKFTPKEEGTMAMKQNYTDKAKLRKKKKTENHSNGGKKGKGEQVKTIRDQGR